ncbi:MAG TPA: hypothetical protein VK400_01155 [Pyrinomonadaceae bacterium]|nr:hypothetical protein [Pyrinomonadaceae bacterium]
MKIYKISFVALFACFALLLTACSQVQNLVQPASPTQTMKNFVEATQKKDAEGMKKALSGGTLKMMDNLAKIQGKTLDDTIREGDATSYQQVPEMRNEKIEGETATLEVKNDKSSDWETLYFVKENNDWKIALDKSFEEAIKKSLTDWKMPDFSNSNSGGNGGGSDNKKP